MTRRSETKLQPVRTSAHTLISKLSAIVGFCQLLQEDLPEDSKCMDHVRKIQSVASALVDEIRAQQRSVSAISRAG